MPTKTDSNPIRIAIAGGGTSGHVNPALAIAEGLKKIKPELEIVFVGNKDGIEKELATRQGYPFVDIAAYPFERNLPEFLKATWEFFKGSRQCKRLIREQNIKAVIGTGGFVAAPLLRAAKSLGLPILIHEQNAHSGRGNKVMSRGADVACISYEKSAPDFSKAKRVVLTGNPIQEIFFKVDKREARAQLGIPEDSFYILATGGSLGARSINRASIELAALYKAEERADSDFKSPMILLSCGKARHKECQKELEKLDLMGYKGLKIEKYLYDMVFSMAAADIVISRAGAIACAELAALAKPMVLVPFPHAMGDHQSYNAKAFVEAGAGLCATDDTLNGLFLFEKIEELRRSPGALAEMGAAAASLARRDATAYILLEFISLLPQVI